MSVKDNIIQYNIDNNKDTFMSFEDINAINKITNTLKILVLNKSLIILGNFGCNLAL